MILHALIVEDEINVLESVVPHFREKLADRLKTDRAFQAANKAAGRPLPDEGRLGISVTAHGYHSRKVPATPAYSPRETIHIRLHLCCERDGTFPHTIPLLQDHFVAVVVSDLRFSDSKLGQVAGQLFIQEIEARDPTLYGILYSAHTCEGVAAERFVRKGAGDSRAEFGGDELCAKVVAGFTAYLNHERVRRFAQALTNRGLLYQSDEFGNVLRKLYDVAGDVFGVEEEDRVRSGHRSPRPTLLIDGETGTSKTELAFLLYEASGRNGLGWKEAHGGDLKNEVALRSTLFGHRKGAFTGAVENRPGLVSEAGKGVLLLDDLHLIDPAASPILHSFLDDGVYAPLGGEEKRDRAACALVCTAETPFWALLKEKQILSPSFIHRVQRQVLRVPPLANRRADIIPLARHFCARHSKGRAELTDEALDWMAGYGFPDGGARELDNFLNEAVNANKMRKVLDAAELREQAAQAGLFPARTEPTQATPSPPSRPPASAALSKKWEFIPALAVRALAQELNLPPDLAQRRWEELRDHFFPLVWGAFQDARPDKLGEKLFVELLRYHAICTSGNPSAAATQLDIESPTLYQFIRERRRTRLPEEET